MAWRICARAEDSFLCWASIFDGFGLVCMQKVGSEDVGVAGCG